MIGRHVPSSLRDRRPVQHETGIMYERTVDFLREVRTELSKVSWPSRNELIGSTTVVIIITLILAAFTGVIDFILSIILSRLLGA